MSYNESLRSNSNYPLMTQSQWDSAPFNTPDPEPMEVSVTVSYSLSKDTVINCTDYIMEEDYDDESNKKCLYPNFDDADLVQAYEDDQMTLPELLDELVTIVKEHMKSLKPNSSLYRHCEDIINAASDWNVDEMEVVQG